MGDFWQMASFLLGVLFLFFFVLAPILARRAQNRELTERFARIQKKRKSRIIAMVHRLEPMGLLGAPNLQYIDLNDAEDIIEAIRSTPPEKPLEIIMHTPGGLVLAALQIARAIKAHPGRVTVFVPHFAMSGGTLIALAADEIVMNTHATLGPIDPQIGGLPAVSILKVVENKPVAATDDFTLLLADVGEKALNQLRDAACELLKGTVTDNLARDIAEELASGRWTHDYPITPKIAHDMGLNVSTEVPPDIMTIMRLFPETVRRRRAVNTFDGEEAKARARDAAPAADQVSFTGFQPTFGARPHSLSPWAPTVRPSKAPKDRK